MKNGDDDDDDDDDQDDDDDGNKKLTTTSIKNLISSTVVVCQRIARIAILYRNCNKQQNCSVNKTLYIAIFS